MTDVAGLHIIESGSRDALPLVFLHAFPLHSAMWDAQRAAVGESARCIAFDVRGLGQSRPADHAFMLEHIVDDLLAVLDALSVQRAVLCGLSMGGYVALRAVERAPERVSGLLLADTQASSDKDAAKLARAEGLRALLSGGLARYADAQLERLLSARTRKSQPQLIAALKQMITEGNAHGVAASLVALATRTDVTASLPRIAVPTRVIVGQDDAVTPESAARALSEAIPGADLHVLPGAGHLSNLEAPDAFNKLLLEHLSRVRG